LNCARHTLPDVTGGCCGHVTRSVPWRAGANALWDRVELSQWRLVGLNLYRPWLNRLRCWAHLLRKARGLKESTDGRVAGVGGEMRDILTKLVEAVLSARASPPPVALTELHGQDIRVCVRCARGTGTTATKK
jgi:hypothetical protein